MRKNVLTLAIGLMALTAAAHPIDFDRIQHWTGTGPNRAALVVQFNGDKYGTDAYVWGYRWEDGEKPTGEDMMKAVCANSSRLSMLTQMTGSMGSTLCGVGYGLNQVVLNHVFFNFEKAKTFEFINFDYYAANSFMGQKDAPGDDSPAIAQAAIDEAIAGTHYIQHPFDYKTYGYPAYDYDCWDIDDEFEEICSLSPYEPKWLAAWYEGYWSYWCANNADQEWMYSGSGFTGRTLVDGAVDGWSFTEFEEAMVGGMGEGVAPCEDAIIYMPARAVNGGVKAAKAVRQLGEGNLSIPLIVRFDNDSRLNNVVLNLNFYSELPSAAEVMGLLNKDVAFEVDGNKISIDADGDGAFNSTALDVSCEGTWTLTEYEDCVMLSCSDTEPQYLVYLPAAGSPAVAIPDEMTFALSDEKNFIPVFVQRAETYDTINYMWIRRTTDDDSNTNNSSDIVSTISTSASSLGQLTYTGSKAGVLYIHLRARTGKGSSFSYSNNCRFTLLPPEIPIESIEFALESVEAPLNATIENALTVLPENATYTTLTYSSSNTKVASASATAIKTLKVAGNATITVASKWNPEVKASFDVVSELRNPVTDFNIQGVEGDIITLNPKQMIGVIAEAVPANADIPDYNVTLTGNGTNMSDYIATMYKVNYWDENNTRIQFYELSGHRVGECTLTLTSTDGSNVSKTYTVKVEEQDRTPLENGYTDGTLLLNEEWFGHTNGGMNYLTPEGEMMYQVYERENPGMSFGCTSQFGTIWAGKLIIVSKQADDGGDPLRGGGRLVVADARTLKRIGSINDLIYGEESKSPDGRGVVGATPDKAYVGTSNGIYIVDINTVEIIGKISDLDESGSAASDLYSGQIGDMVHAGKYVFGIKQNTGAFAIDTETDAIVRKYPITTVQGITQTADGHIWIASTVSGCAKFTCIDPETLDEVEDMTTIFPSTVSAPTCSWGAWRNTPFVGSHSRNTIWFSAGGGIAGGSSSDKYYGWEVGSDPSELTPLFDMAQANLIGSNARVKQKTYGTLRYDDRSEELIVMTTEDSASGHYRYNWTHFIDPATGEIKRTIALRPYYWFQAFAIFPDKHDAVIDLDEITLSFEEGEQEIKLAEVISDKDNIDANIKIYLADRPAVLNDDTEIAHTSVSLEGKTLKVAPVSIGTDYITLAAESNGRTVSKTIAISVQDQNSGLKSIHDTAGTITCDGHRIQINGFAGQTFHVLDVAGRQVAAFDVDSDSYIFDFGAHAGVYLVSSDNITTKVIIR